MNNLFTGVLWAASTVLPPLALAQAGAPPKLVVGIVVDQMRYDYLTRYWSRFGNGGFKRLVGEGFSCTNATYDYVPTYTAPGHAAVFTGTGPAQNGIIGNNWYARATGRTVYCTDDAAVQAVGGSPAAGQMSPKNLTSSTITDELRLHSNTRSKVIGVALKDRGAILPAGHLASGAYWYDAQTGTFMTSTYYMAALPAWVAAFNQRNLPARYLGQSWTTLLPLADYLESDADDSPYEGRFQGEARATFPHDLPAIQRREGFGALSSTPFGNSLTKDFALAALAAENLGRGPATDFLTVSFSSTDYVGHRYGPGAIEVEDTYLRLDRDLAELLRALDQAVGTKNVLVFLTADHGAAEVPAYLAARHLPGGAFQSRPAIRDLKAHLQRTYGDSLVLAYSNQQVYLNRAALTQRGHALAAVQQDVASFLTAYPGVAGTVTATALASATVAEGQGHLVQQGYYGPRSGDVAVTLEPGWLEAYSATGTTHGSGYRYDTHVPLLWYGWRIPKGRRSARPVHVRDIAPTLAGWLGTSFPSGTTGEPLDFLIP